MDKNCTPLQDSIEIIDTFRKLPKSIQLAALGWAIAKAGESLDILTNKNHTVLYVGRSKQLKIRLRQHKKNDSNSFTGKYNVDKLVYFETTKYVNHSIKRERQIKKWNREWKINLVNNHA